MREALDRFRAAYPGEGNPAGSAGAPGGDAGRELVDGAQRGEDALELDVVHEHLQQAGDGDEPAARGKG